MLNQSIALCCAAMVQLSAFLGQNKGEKKLFGNGNELGNVRDREGLAVQPLPVAFFLHVAQAQPENPYLHDVVGQKFLQMRKKITPKITKSEGRKRGSGDASSARLLVTPGSPIPWDKQDEPQEMGIKALKLMTAGGRSFYPPQKRLQSRAGETGEAEVV